MRSTRGGRGGVWRWVGSGMVVAASMLAGCSGGPAPVERTPLTVEQRNLNVESFDQVWTTIRDEHFDPTLGGLDWNAVKAELRPKVETAGSMEAAREAMSAMIARLGQSHFGIIPAAAYDEVEGDKPADKKDDKTLAGDGASGVHFRAVNDQAVVLRVDSGSAAERAGVKPGWILDGAERTLTAIKKAYGDTVKGRTMAARALDNRLSGGVGEVINPTFIDDKDRKVTLPITLGAPAGKPTTLGNLPTMYVTFDSRRIADTSAAGRDVGYFTFSAFLDPARIMPKIVEAVASFGDCAGIVIDLRGNPGGIGAMATGVAGRFIGEQVTLGEMNMRDSNFKFIVFPQARRFEGPVAIIVDETSASTSEIFAGGMKDLGRARVFGTPSAGQALPSTIVRLPNGDGFQYAFANYVSAGGKALEGDGVTPDTIAPPERSRLLAGGDPALDAAVAWIREQQAKVSLQ
ncbi:MAG: hypothetical protein HEQ23_04945 [Tepidisphaera sp.]